MEGSSRPLFSEGQQYIHDADVNDAPPLAQYHGTRLLPAEEQLDPVDHYRKTQFDNEMRRYRESLGLEEDFATGGYHYPPPDEIQDCWGARYVPEPGEG